MDPSKESLPPPERAYPSTGLARLKDILTPNGPIPVSRSTWWQGVKDGRFPKPIYLGPRVPVWSWEQISALAKTGVV
jgi:prophage regulatory protein